MAIMAILAAVLYTSPAISIAAYHYFGALENYLPILWRYHTFFELAGKTSDFPILFSIAILNIVIQLMILSIIIYLVHGKISLRPVAGVSRKPNILLAILILVALDPTVELFLGPYDLASMWLGTHSSTVSIVSVYFRYCFLVPAANMLLGFLILTRFPVIDPHTQT